MKIIVNKSITIKQFVLIAILGVIVGLCAIYMGLRCVIKVNILKTYKIETAEIVYSEIVDTQRTNDESSSHRRKIKYNYKVGNKTYIGEDILWWRIFNSDINAKVGDKVKIIYAINNASASEVYHISYLFIIFGLVCIPFVISALITRIKEESEE